MIKYESECVGPCPQGCMSSACPYYSVAVKYCDRCGKTAESLYQGPCGYEEMCEDCAKEEIEAIFEDASMSELCEYFGFSEVRV